MVNSGSSGCPIWKIKSIPLTHCLAKSSSLKPAGMVIFRFNSSGSPAKDSIVGYFSTVSLIICEALCELGSSVGAAGGGRDPVRGCGGF